MDDGSARLMDGVATALLAAMLAIPFLLPLHYRPIPSFWHEWWAVVLGLGLIVAVLVRPGAWSPLRVPGITLIPLSLIALILIQYFVGRIYFPRQALLFAGMLFWTLLLSVTGRRLADSRGLEGLAGIAATALVGGALANALVLLVQITGADVSARLVFHQPNLMFGGNLAQPNHLNDQLWLGLGSLLYLHARGRCRDLAALAITLGLLAASTMTGSRSTLLYAAAFVGLAWLAGRDRDRALELRTLQRSAWILGALALAMLLLHRAAEHFGLLPASHPPSAFERFFADAGGFGLRWSFWQRTWHIFLHFPWLGAGVGGLPWQDYLSIDELPASSMMVVFEHSHNLFLQLLAETGILSVVVLLLVLLRWLRGLGAMPWTPAKWWTLALLAVIGIHSQLEYPLWYAFFLGPTALLLGAIDAPLITMEAPRPWIAGAAMVATLAAAAAGGVVLIQLCLDYQQLQQRANPWIAKPPLDADDPFAGRQAAMLWHDSLLAPYVGFSMSFPMGISPDSIDTKTEICRQARHLYPQADVAFKCALIDALAGRKDQAKNEVERAMKAHPTAIGELDQMLEAAKRYPQLRALREQVRRRENKSL